MSRNTIPFLILAIIGAVSAFLSGWSFLLNCELRSLAFALVSLFLVIASIIRIRRQ